MKKIIHLNHPINDFTLCGDSEDGVFLDEKPEYSDSEPVTCETCLAIIAVCLEYSRRPTQRAPDARKSALKKVSSNKKGSAKPARG
jgi:hypothetical protein